MRISDWSSDVCSSDLSVALMDLERDAETSRTLYISLLTRLKELQRQDQLARADASFVSRAPLAMSPSYPATKRILAVALLASVIIAVILAFAAESVDRRVRTSEQAERLTGTRPDEHTSELPSLMRIPHADLRSKTN